MHTELLQLCPALYEPMNCSSPGTSVDGILQARILELVAMPSSRGSHRPRVKPTSLMPPALAGMFFTTSSTWEALNGGYLHINISIYISIHI